MLPLIALGVVLLLALGAATVRQAPAGPSSFEAAVAVVLRHEGGWVDDSADPGGETNYGWSMLTIRRLALTAADLGISTLAPGGLRELSVSTATSLYRRFFWDPQIYAECITQTVATKLMDTAVNTGPANAHRIAQLAANDCGAQLEVDGAFGPLSLAAVNALEPRRYLAAFAKRQAGYYEALIAARPSLDVFRTNWLRRAAWVG